MPPLTTQIPAPVGAYSTFITTLHDLTGLSVATIATWVDAERGPKTNPLGIQPAGRMTNFGSQQDAAKATARLLKSDPAYAPILRAAADPAAGPAEELAAITRSPWNGACQYRGNNPDGSCIASNRPGALLLVRWHQLFGAAAAPGSGPVTRTSGRGGGAAVGADARGQGAGKGFKAAAGGIAGLVEAANPAHWIGGVEKWVERKSLTAGLYVTFTILALGLVFVSLRRAGAPAPSLPRPSLGRRAAPGSPGFFDGLGELA